MRIAKELGHTCYRMYESMKTGLAPELVRSQEALQVCGAVAEHLRAEDSLVEVRQKLKTPLTRDEVLETPLTLLL